jgi:hypothetical protein
MYQVVKLHAKISHSIIFINLQFRLDFIRCNLPLTQIVIQTLDLMLLPYKIYVFLWYRLYCFISQPTKCLLKLQQRHLHVPVTIYFVYLSLYREIVKAIDISSAEVFCLFFELCFLDDRDELLH